MNDHVVIPLENVPHAFVLGYWDDLHFAGLLKYRICDEVDPDLASAVRLMDACKPHVYFVVRENRVVAEFSLTGFTGKSAQVHFSMHPDNSPQESMHYARTCTDSVLHEWFDGNDAEEPFLYSMYGLTPVPNRAACAFVRRVGFKKIGVLKRGQRFDGDVVDAMITIKERDNGR